MFLTSQISFIEGNDSDEDDDEGKNGVLTFRLRQSFLEFLLSKRQR